LFIYLFIYKSPITGKVIPNLQ